LPPESKAGAGEGHGSDSPVGRGADGPDGRRAHAGRGHLSGIGPDLVVDGKTLAKDVPVTNLLVPGEAADRSCNTFIDKLPTLDSAEEWTSTRTRISTRPRRREPYARARVSKHDRACIRPTKEHPAQTQLVQEDITAGHWATVKFSGAIPCEGSEPDAGSRGQAFRGSQFAREQANSIEVKDRKVGKVLVRLHIWRMRGGRISSCCFLSAS